MATSEVVRALLTRRLIDAEVSLEAANRIMDESMAEREGHQLELQPEQLVLMQRCIELANQLAEGYETQLPQGV